MHNAMRNPISALVVTFALLCLIPAASAAAQGCPQTDNPVARYKLEALFTSEAFTDERGDWSIWPDGYTRARVVRDSDADAWVCSAIRGSVKSPELLTAPWMYTIYFADGKYYVVWVKSPLEETRIRIENGVLRGEAYWSPIGVYDNTGAYLFGVLA